MNPWLIAGAAGLLLATITELLKDKKPDEPEPKPKKKKKKKKPKTETPAASIVRTEVPPVVQETPPAVVVKSEVTELDEKELPPDPSGEVPTHTQE